MAVPVEQFVKQLEDSGILDGDTLKNFIPPQASPKDAEELARELVKQKKLTKFQAEEVYRGKGKSLTLGNYLLLEKIGAGGMGQVFKARHRRMDRLVAVKLLPPAMTKDKAAIARFEREVKAAAKLRHPNIVAADDADQANGVHFLVMELVEGSDLSALVKKNGPFGVDQAVNYITQAARGLEAAHAEGIVHRDIKPANLLLDKKETVKILDMGLARIEGSVDAPTQAELTSTGTVMGTVDYMAPEQALNTKTADARADIYSLGCSLFYLLCGKATYDGDSLMAKLLNHREHPIPSLRATRPEVSELLDSVFAKMVAKKVEHRYQTMTEVITDLERCRTFNEQTVTFQQPLPDGSSSSSTTNPSLSNFLAELSQSTTEAMVAKPAAKPKAEPSNKRLKLIAAGVLGGLILLFGIIAKLKTKEGKLIVEVNEPGAVVQVLDEEGKVQITRKNEQGAITISVVPGKHQLKVEKDGFKVITKDFEIETNGTKTISAKLIPLKKTTTIAGKTPPASSEAIEGKFALQFEGMQSVEAENVPPLASTVVTLESWLSIMDVNWESVYSTGNIVQLPSQQALRWTYKSEYSLYTFHGGVVVPNAAIPNSRVHLAGVNDGKQRRLYLNGKLIGKTDDPGDLNPDAKPGRLLIGGINQGLGFYGVIDTMRVSTVARYDRDFTPPTTFTPDKDTLALYLFNEGQGDVLKDSSGHGYHAKINGAKWVKLGAEANKTSATPAWTGWPKDAPPPAIAPFDAEQAKKHQATWAAYLKVPVEYKNSIGMKFTLIPPGEFLMGTTTEVMQAELERVRDYSPSDVHWHQCIQSGTPQHRVILTEPIYLGVHEVTQKDYQQLIGQNPSYYSAAGAGSEVVRGLNTETFPVEQVTWDEATVFCARLSQKERLAGGYPDALKADNNSLENSYRLPTEAEWEFACRAGSFTQFWNGDNDSSLADIGWFGANSSNRTHAVGELLGNPFGLYDVHGNVSEWVQDWWSPHYYEQFRSTAAVNPRGPNSPTDQRVIRGGYYAFGASLCWSWFRNAHLPTDKKILQIGFRIALPIAAVRNALNSPLNSPAQAVAPFDGAQAKKHQEAWAKHLGTTVETTNSVGAKMILIPPGEFVMGSTDEQVAAALKLADEVGADERTRSRIQNAERPQHPMKIEQPFLIGQTEVTVGQFRQFVESTKYVTETEQYGFGSSWLTVLNEEVLDWQKGQNWREPLRGIPAADGMPVSQLTMNDVLAYCQWLSTQEKTTYRLPTEAEWEYACRAGTTTMYSFGDDPKELQKFAWYGDKSGDRPRPVATKLPNAFGLNDMHGNMIERCSDFFDEKRYEKRLAGTSPDSGQGTVFRGGNWQNNAAMCRSAFRVNSSPTNRNAGSGFRVVRELDVRKTTVSVTPQPVVPAVGSPIQLLASPDYEWSVAENLGPLVNSAATELHPHLSFDGLTLLFASDRTGGQGDADLWSSTRKSLNESFGAPVNLGPNVNGPAAENGPCLSRDGLILWFGSNRDGGRSRLWESRRATSDQPFGIPTLLSGPVNADGSVIGPDVSSDGLTLMFESTRAGGLGRFDLWMASRRAPTEPFGLPVNLGATVNSSASNEGGPVLSADRLTLIFHSGRPGGQGEQDDLWITTRTNVDAPWSSPVRLSGSVNSPGFESHPTLSGDNGTLIFASNRTGSSGPWDLWMSRHKMKTKVATLPAQKAAPPIATAPFDAKQARAHQEAWAKHLGTTVETTNSVGAKMILIPPGEFLMGSTDEQVEAALKVADEIKAIDAVRDRIQKAERPQHKVVITKPFLMSATEVTIGQFKKFAAATSYQTEAEKAETATKAAPPKPTQTYINPGYVVSGDSPAAFITWKDATAYCQWLSTQEKATYRLPTEAEWEYACRAGTTTQYSFGDDYNELPKYGWHNKNAENKSHPVGTLLPNPFGLFDMHGNLQEWCGDYYDEKWYSASAPNDPNGPSAGSTRVVRGGFWSSTASYCRSAFRSYYTPSSLYYYNYGFRCVSVFDATAK